MIGILLLIISIILYIKGYKKWSILLFVFFMTNGLRILTDDIIGIKNRDLAFIYTITICLYSAIHEKGKIIEDHQLRRSIDIFFLFMLCSIAFSYFHYNFSWYQILQGGRQHFLFISYYFIRKVKVQDIEWIFQKLFLITFITAILYIIQVIIGLSTLPYSENIYGELAIDTATGVKRFYNSPSFLNLFLYLSILYPKYIKSRFRKYAPYVFLATLFCTLGRTYIILTLLGLSIGLLLKGQSTKFIKALLIIGVCLLPFANILVSRLENKGETSNDIEEILSGKYKESVKYDIQNSGTLSYRFAWVYERIEYLAHRPIGENIFGLGMITDTQTRDVYQKYRFYLGLINPKTGIPYQLSTPDISYGNLITQFGYVGGIILLYIWIIMMIGSYKHRNDHPLIFCLFITLLSYIAGSISSSVISETGNLIMPFLLFTLLTKNRPKIKHHILM